MGRKEVYDLLNANLEIRNQWQNCSSGSFKQKPRETGNGDISVIVWEWFVSVRARNFRIHGPMIWKHAFDCGWIETKGYYK
jgi:hypothetical protein